MVLAPPTTITRPSSATARPAHTAGRWGWSSCPSGVRLTQHPAYDEYWQDQAVDRILAQKPLTVPTLLVDSLWDQEDIYGAPAVFDAVKASPNAHLVLGPWHHGQANGIGGCARPDRLGQRHRHAGSAQNVIIPFLDQYLKGGPPANIARVTAFEAGTNQWRRLADWPLACARACPANLTPLYLAPGDRLELRRARRRGFDSYVSDPARPVTYRARPNLSPCSPRLDLAHLAESTTSASPRPAPTSSLTRPRR